jgi:thiamine biosynthesis lipoprotein
MASPCEVLIDTGRRRDARRVLSLIAGEARRIEAKFSRYRSDSIVSSINRCDVDVEVDGETARLLDYSGKLFDLSGGKFDVTSGVLRKVWTFDGSDRLPEDRDVENARRHVGWERVRWRHGKIALPPGMEIDFGGIAKEYAVDAAALLAAKAFPDFSCLVNFGGDLALSVPRNGGLSWRVGIEEARVDAGTATRGIVRLFRGGLATSGDARRFLLKDGVRYSHILDPETGWPVRDAPRSITVAAPTCTDAGMLATFAMLQGREAERFLAIQGVDHWIQR